MALDIEQYIRQAAVQRGIDPDIAIRVAKSEGGLKDPTRQSMVMKNGVREPSYGPFQLLVGGSNGFPTGMGNQALAAGIDPRNPDHAYRGIDFALDQAKNSGWGAWYGAKAQGITGKMGIGDNPYAGMADGPKGQESYPPSGPQPTGLAAATGLPGGILGGIPQGVANYASASDGNEKSQLHRLGDALSEYQGAPPVRFGPMGDARQSGDELLKKLQQLRRG